MTGPGRRRRGRTRSVGGRGAGEVDLAGMESTGQVMNHDELPKTALKFGRIPAKDHHAGLHHRPGDANARHPHGEEDVPRSASWLRIKAHDPEPSSSNSGWSGDTRMGSKWGFLGQQGDALGRALKALDGDFVAQTGYNLPVALPRGARRGQQVAISCGVFHAHAAHIAGSRDAWQTGWARRCSSVRCALAPGWGGPPPHVDPGQHEGCSGPAGAG